MSFTLQPETEADPVRRFTSPEALRQIEESLEQSIRYYAAQPPEQVSERIEELKQEWSIERLLQVNVSIAAFLTAFLALTRRRGYAIFTCTALGFFLYHALSGFAPPIPLLRKMGIRTRREIDREIYALKALRGDFNSLENQENQEFKVAAREILQAVNS